MNKLFVSYELALLAKEKGFNQPCIAKYVAYNKGEEILLHPHTQDFFKGYIATCTNSEYKEIKDKCAAPLYQQLVDWFREKHSICIGNVGDKVHGFSPYISKNSTIIYALWSPLIPDYYDSFNRALEEAFKLI